MLAEDSDRIKIVCVKQKRKNKRKSPTMIDVVLLSLNFWLETECYSRMFQAVLIPLACGICCRADALKSLPLCDGKLQSQRVPLSWGLDCFKIDIESGSSSI